MTIEEYQTLTGITVSTSQVALVTAQIERTRAILEDMLGFTLDEDLIDEDQLNEIGKTKVDCPFPSDSLTLDPADAIVFAYRLFPYNQNDDYLAIDPASEIHKVKLVKDGVTYLTLDADQYRAQFKNNIIKFLEQVKCWCSCFDYCKYVQLAVDATWLWDEDSLPSDLKYVWCDMITYYSDLKKDVKSETLGPHSYTKADTIPVELKERNIAVIKKYAGPNGSIKRSPTI